LRDGDFVRYRCRVGHAWTGEGLVAKQSDILDDALWTALRSLEESVSLSRQLANRHRARGNATRF
jgi:two-component system chemotaxis response regulator CheB